MVLVDTSAWIQVFRKRNRLRLDTILDLDEVVTCLPVIQEVLQGFRDERAFRVARDAMLALPVVESPLSVDVVQSAVELYRLARRKGITVRSSVDCLIAVCAIRNGLELLHKDRDFDALATISRLEIREEV